METTISMWSAGSEAVPAPAPDLLERARRGEPEAFDRLYRQHARAAYTLALRVTGRPDQAEDVVQDAFLKAFESIARFRGDAPFGAWLKRLVVNAAIDRVRAQRRRPGDDAALEHIEAADLAPDRSLDALGLLARLSHAARMVVVLHELEGFSHTEIAAGFGRSESWSKSLLARARARLADWLQEEGTA